MKRNLMSLLPFTFGFLLWLILGIEAALVWFMAYYLLMAVRLLLLKRQQKALPPIFHERLIQIIDPRQSD